MPISELCSSFYLFKPLEKCVLFDTRGMGYESVAWYESISITGQKTSKITCFATRISMVWFLTGEDGSPSYTSVGSAAQPLSSPTGYFPLLLELSSLGAQFIFGYLGELSRRGNSPSDLWHLFQQAFIEWLFFCSQIIHLSFLMQPLSFKN